MSRLSHNSLGALLPLALLLAGSAGCGVTDPSSDAIPATAQRIEAPAEYKHWFEKTEACAGRDGRFERIQWYVVPGAQTIDTELGPKIALWVRSGGTRSIVVAGNWAQDEFVISHEILHDLLDAGDHPSEYFVNRCRLTWESREQGAQLAGLPDGHAH